MKIDALVMAGGKGTRLGGTVEKPMVEILGIPIIRYVLDALPISTSVDRIYCATSPGTPETEEYLKEMDCTIIECPGDGYVKDLQFCIKELGLEKVLVVSADLPLLGPGDIDWVVEEYEKRGGAHMAVYCPQKDGGPIPAGVNIVDSRHLDEPKDEILVSDKVQFALNVNTPEDLEKAKSILKERARINQ